MLMMMLLVVVVMMMREVKGGKDWRIMTGGRQCNLTHRSNQNTIDRCDDHHHGGDDDDHDDGEEDYDCVRDAELAQKAA